MRIDTLVLITAILGVVLVIYSQFVERENRRDLIRMVGAFGVFVYALFILNPLFIALTAGIFLAALVELIEILTGRHVHRPLDTRK